MHLQSKISTNLFIKSSLNIQVNQGLPEYNSNPSQFNQEDEYGAWMKCWLQHTKMLPDQNAEFDERWLSLSVFCLKTTSSLPPVWPDAQCSWNWTPCYLPSLTIQTSSPSFTEDAEYSLYISTVIAVWLQMPNVACFHLIFFIFFAYIFIWFPKEATGCELNCTVTILFIVCWIKMHCHHRFDEKW